MLPPLAILATLALTLSTGTSTTTLMAASSAMPTSAYESAVQDACRAAGYWDYISADLVATPPVSACVDGEGQLILINHTPLVWRAWPSPGLPQDPIDHSGLSFFNRSFVAAVESAESDPWVLLPESTYTFGAPGGSVSWAVDDRWTLAYANAQVVQAAMVELVGWALSKTKAGAVIRACAESAYGSYSLTEDLEDATGYDDVLDLAKDSIDNGEDWDECSDAYSKWRKSKKTKAALVGSYAKAPSTVDQLVELPKLKYEKAASLTQPRTWWSNLVRWFAVVR